MPKRTSMTVQEWSAVGTLTAFAGDPHIKVVQEAAARRNIDIESVDESSYFLSHGRRTVLFHRHLPGLTSAAARYISNDKQSSKLFLQRAGVLTPEGQVFTNTEFDEALAFAKTIGFPVVVKPLSDSGGKGVTAEVQGADHFKRAWETAKTTPKGRLIVEKHVYGNDYRLFVVNGKFICAAQRIPVNITGDGVSTVAELIAKKNEERRLNPYVGSKAIKLSSEMKLTLKRHKFDEMSVIPAGRNIRLLPVANIGTGGDSKDITDTVHPGFKDVAVRAAEAIPGAFFSGVDLIAPDITRSPDEQVYAIPEINARADIALHHFPLIGKPRDVAGALLEAIFPEAGIVPVSRMRRVQLTLLGKVIGVGMRKHIEQLAVRNHLFGWVRNEGQVVRAVLCGSDSAVERVVQQLSKRHLTTVECQDWLGDIPQEFTILD